MLDQLILAAVHRLFRRGEPAAEVPSRSPAEVWAEAHAAYLAGPEAGPAPAAPYGGR
ncbi:hypothetical protein AB0H73_38645 [Streptomyces olivoreticuli]